MHRYELHVGGQRALGIDVVEEHDLAREVLPQSGTVVHHGEGSEAPRVVEVFLTSSAHGQQLLWQQLRRYSGGDVCFVPRRSRSCQEVSGLGGETTRNVSVWRDMSAVYIPRSFHSSEGGEKMAWPHLEDAACGNCLTGSNHGLVVAHGLKRSGVTRPSGFLVAVPVPAQHSTRCKVGHEPIKNAKTCAVTTAAEKAYLTTRTASWSVLKSGHVVEAKMRTAVVEVSMFFEQVSGGVADKGVRSACSRESK